MTEAQKRKMREKAAKLSKPSPVELPSGKWRCQITVDGERISVIEDDPAVAHAKALAIKAGALEKAEEAKKRTVLKLSDAIDEYVNAREGVLSPATVRGYNTVKNNRFKGIMERNIYELKKQDIQVAISAEAKLVSAKTVSNGYGLIRPVLKEYGIDVFGVKLPQQIKKPKKYLQPDDIGKLMKAAEGDTCEIAILIAALLGLRRSEIIGLCWDSIDFDNKTITVSRTVVPDKNHKWVTKDGAKNMSSQRTISCPEIIMEKLQAIRKPPSEKRVFNIHPDTLRRHIHAVCKKAGITDTTVHGLRHTNAAVMKSLGVDDAHAMARGGWSNETTYKKTYSYVFDQEAISADKKIEDYFEKLHTNLHTKEDDA